MPRGGSKPRPIDYELVERLANLNMPDYEIAQALDFSVTWFNQRKNGWIGKDGKAHKPDRKLQRAIEKGSIDGKVSLRRAMMRTSLDRYFTVCRECEKISTDAFHAKCQFCGTENVQHRFIPASTSMQIWLSKNWLHMKDDVEIEEKIESGLTEIRETLSRMKLDAVESSATDE